LGDNDAPEWLRTRRLAPHDHSESMFPLRPSQLVLLGLVLAFAAASVYIFLDTPDRLVIGLVPTGVAVVVLIVITERVYSMPIKATYLAVAGSLNAYLTVAADGGGAWAYFSLASMVLFSGVAGLAMLDADVRPMPKARRVAVFLFVLVFFLAANVYASLPADGSLGHLRTWLEAAYIPLSALVVLSLAFVAIYPRGAQTMPADKWV
jgi:hypothetical protein